MNKLQANHRFLSSCSHFVSIYSDLNPNFTTSIVARIFLNPFDMWRISTEWILMISYTCGIKWACTASLSCYTQIVCKRLVPTSEEHGCTVSLTWEVRFKQSGTRPPEKLSTIQGRSLLGRNGSVVCKDNPLRCCKDMNPFFRFCHWSTTPTDVGLDLFFLTERVATVEHEVSEY